MKIRRNQAFLGIADCLPIMGKSFLYRWFGTGKVPKKFREQIEREGVLLSEEGIGGSITFINFR